MIRVLAVDDHPLILAGLRAMLALQGDMELVAEAESGEGGHRCFHAAGPDVTLMDLKMRGIGGVEAIRRIRRDAGDACILALSTYEGDEIIFQALAAGAQGYLLKDMLRASVCDAIRRAYVGERVIPPPVAARLGSVRAGLTPRELDVLRLTARGLSNKEIARVLACAPATIKSHVENLLRKLGVSDRAEAVAAAIERGFLL